MKLQYEVGDVHRRYDLSWEITVKEEKLTLLQEQAGCFVILTNVPLESLDAASVLRTYKGQYGIESDFSLSALGLDERVFYDKQVRCVLTRRHA